MEDAFKTGVFPNNKAVRQELKAAVVKAVNDKIRDKQADPTICRVTCAKLKSGSFVTDLSHCVIEDDNGVRSLATYAKRHV